MKKIIILCFISAASIQCNKNNTQGSPITDVTGTKWELFSVQKTNDPYTNPLPVDWSLQLNDNRSFSFDLHGVNGTGTYSWTQVDSLNSGIRFTIQNWNFPVADTQYTNRLKTILQDVNSCHYLKGQDILPLPFTLSIPKMELQFSGSAGWFYVFTY